MAREAILNREIFFEARNGRFRKFDWNSVNTSLGGCWEPVQFNHANNSGEELDFDDCINRVDKISINKDFRNPYHRDPDSNQILTGGVVFLGRSLAFDDN